ncbi:MAG: DUF5011 domain-containing protein [Epsilonproteobacteria bacterium]|nr:DUF5011 domain-containing protein [Campylobacterota bacterium]
MYKYLVVLFSIVAFIGCGSSVGDSSSSSKSSSNSSSKDAQTLAAPIIVGDNPSYNSFRDSFDLYILGKKGADVIVDQESIGTLEDNIGKITIPLRGEDGKKVIEIRLKYNNQISPPLKLEVYKDTTPPEIYFNGEMKLKVQKGSSFEDEGAEAVDNIDGKVEVKREGFVNINKIGNYQICYEAIDRAKNRAYKCREIEVVDNLAPVAKDDEVYVKPGEKILVDVLANDKDLNGDSLEVVGILNEITQGKASIKDNKIEYIAPLNFEGNVIINYKIEDELGASDSAYLMVHVDDTLDDVVKNDYIITEVGVPVLIDPLLNDNIDPKSFNYRLDVNESGTVSATDSFNLIFIPNKDFKGDTQISYEACDNSRCYQAKIYISVKELSNLNNEIKMSQWGFKEFDVYAKKVLSPGDNIQEAIDSLSNGGIVYLLKGDYHIDNKIVLKSNIVLEGEGIDKSRIILDNNRSEAIVALGDLNNIAIKNLTVDVRSQEANISNGILFGEGVDNILVENLKVFGSGKSNLIVYNENATSSHITFRNIISYGSKLYHGVALRKVKGAILDGVISFYNKGYGVDISMSDHIEMANSSILQNNYGSKFPGSTYVYFHHSLISGNGVVGIKFNRLSDSFEPMNFHLESLKVINNMAGIVDWGDSVSDPHFDIFVAKDMTIKDNFGADNKSYDFIRLKSGNWAYSYGDDLIRNRDNNEITNEFKGYYIKSGDIDPKEDGVGYTTWPSL